MASFGIGLRIENDKGRYLSGTPLRLRLQKQCADNLKYVALEFSECSLLIETKSLFLFSVPLTTQVSPDPECDRKCANGGRCNAEKICECPKRYMGRYCRTGKS
ncbi:hypothetical protein HPB51_020847 [Rhipicephalus microplus]|uniref:EGF-like domain-containing protein n=1 Tax=Rhipicephalus microplus TaxID=6941 RepID=A0A9J6ECH8_RHIMP|nr:hypothetical protein HPB51_020847 [Rhipicephalus microplus]